MNNQFTPVVFIGAGNFAEMMLKGIFTKRILNAEEIIATVRREERAKRLREVFGIRVDTENLNAVRESPTIVLCVKPQDLHTISDSIDAISIKDKLLVSVVAGVSLKELSDLFKVKLIFRANPNPPVEVACGFTAIANTPKADDKAKEWIRSLFSCLGETMFINESCLDAVSVLSGIAHVLYFYESLIEAGIYVGLSKEISEKIVSNSITGAMELLAQRKDCPSDLIKAVTTPGGIGVEKIFVFENRGLRGIIIDAIRSAKEKAASLGKP